MNRRPWPGSFFVRCAICLSSTVEPIQSDWRLYADRDATLHAFCPRCAEYEFGDAPPEPFPVAMCPECDGRLEPQPLGGWVCVNHGLVVVPNLGLMN